MKIIFYGMWKRSIPLDYFDVRQVEENEDY